MFGARIRNFISKKGLKLMAVADRAGIPLNIFSAMVNGKRKITIEEYIAICHALEVPLDEFVEK